MRNKGTGLGAALQDPELRPEAHTQRSGRSSGAGWQKRRGSPGQRGGGAESRQGHLPRAAAPHRPLPCRFAACPGPAPHDLPESCMPSTQLQYMNEKNMRPAVYGHWSR